MRDISCWFKGALLSDEVDFRMFDVWAFNIPCLAAILQTSYIHRRAGKDLKHLLVDVVKFPVF